MALHQCLRDRGSARERGSEKSSDNGCIPDELGGCFSWQIDKQLLDTPASQTSHKSFGVDDCLSNPETFSPVLERFSCSGQDRQHDIGSIYQLPRGNVFIGTT